MNWLSLGTTRGPTLEPRTQYIGSVSGTTRGPTLKPRTQYTGSVLGTTRGPTLKPRNSRARGSLGHHKRPHITIQDPLTRHSLVQGKTAHNATQHLTDWLILEQQKRPTIQPMTRQASHGPGRRRRLCSMENGHRACKQGPTVIQKARFLQGSMFFRLFPSLPDFAD